MPIVNSVTKDMYRKVYLFYVLLPLNTNLAVLYQGYFAFLILVLEETPQWLYKFTFSEMSLNCWDRHY